MRRRRPAAQRLAPQPITDRRLSELRHESGAYDYCLSSDVLDVIARLDQARGFVKDPRVDKLRVEARSVTHCPSSAVRMLLSRLDAAEGRTPPARVSTGSASTAAGAA